MNWENFKVLTQNITFQRNPCHLDWEGVMIDVKDKYENQRPTVNTQDFKTVIIVLL